VARKVLPGETRGHRNHPQLERFKGQHDRIGAVDEHLLAIFEEVKERGFVFSREKIGSEIAEERIIVTDGQPATEMSHLKEKPRKREVGQYEKIAEEEAPRSNPVF